MKTVLLVDDERPFVQSLKDGLLSSGKRLRVLTAGNGREAIERLQDTEVHLVVTDLNMPEVDGLALLAYVGHAHPRLPVIVMTAFGSPETESRVSALGAMRCVEKPIDFADLSRSIFEYLSLPTSYLNGITVSSFVQLIHHERKSCTLRATSAEVPPRSGELHFEAGELVNARLGPQGGLAAAYEILAWDGASLELEDARAVEHAIHASLENVLMQSLVLNDERIATEPEETAETALFPSRGGQVTAAPDDTARFDAIVRRLHEAVPELDAAAVVDVNGRLVFASGGLDAARLGPLLSGLIGMAETAAGGLAQGAFRRATIESAGGRLVVAAIDDAHYAVVVARPAARLGLLYLGLDEAVRALSGLLLVLACREG